MTTRKYQKNSQTCRNYSEKKSKVKTRVKTRPLHWKKIKNNVCFPTKACIETLTIGPKK